MQNHNYIANISFRDDNFFCVYWSIDPDKIQYKFHQKIILQDENIYIYYVATKVGH